MWRTVLRYRAATDRGVSLETQEISVLRKLTCQRMWIFLGEVKGHILKDLHILRLRLESSHIWTCTRNCGHVWRNWRDLARFSKIQCIQDTGDFTIVYFRRIRSCSKFLANQFKYRGMIELLRADPPRRNEGRNDDSRHTWPCALKIRVLPSRGRRCNWQRL